MSAFLYGDYIDDGCQHLKQISHVRKSLICTHRIRPLRVRHAYKITAGNLSLDLFRVNRDKHSSWKEICPFDRRHQGSKLKYSYVTRVWCVGTCRM